VDIHRATLDNCDQATGTVVVVDVLRAFTTAPYAFAAGVVDIWMVSDVEEAFALREENPTFLITGEVGGEPVEGFDFDNSPSQFVGRDLSGRHLIQRTSSGTQGVVRSRKADGLLAASLCCASATVDHILRGHPASVTLVITGSHPGGLGDEDVACADYLEALLRGDPPDRGAAVERVLTSRAARKFLDRTRAGFSPRDLACAIAIDRFDFAMEVERRESLCVVRAVRRGQRVVSR